MIDIYTASFKPSLKMKVFLVVKPFHKMVFSIKKKIKQNITGLFQMIQIKIHLLSYKLVLKVLNKEQCKYACIKIDNHKKEDK